MKKKTGVAFVAGVLSLSVLLGATACGGDDEPLTFDREAKAFSAPQATISLDGTVDKNSARKNISDTLFGVFLEDINYASYALDDNLLINYSFETPQGVRANSTTPNTANDFGWSVEGGGTSLAVKENQSDGPLGELYKDYNGKYVNGNYATVTTGGSGGKLINAGYRDPSMAVTEGTEYLFSAFLKTASDVELTLSVTNGTEVYLEGTLSVKGGDWVKYQKTLKATKTGTSGLRFEIAVAGAAEFSIDGVKLETKDSTIGIKNYAYQAIKDLAPKFIRFPGGCVIEGVDEGTAYDWKNSIGAVAQTDKSTGDKVPAFTYTLNDEGTEKTQTTYGEQLTRRANTDIWYADGEYYEMEYGIGFYDYFLLCDTIGASPVPVINCGYSDQGGINWRHAAHQLKGRHGNKTDDYIQDALDLVCFANGSVNSSDKNEAYWAQVRTDMGHAEPFGLKYLGIGNEQFGNTYFVQHYEKFVEAFVEAKKSNSLYEGIELIVGNGMFLSNCENPPVSSSLGMAQDYAEKYVFKNQNAVIDKVVDYGVHDQHYYVNYLDLFTNTQMYDEYTRPADDKDSYYHVFVGEYSANSMQSAGASYGADSPWANSWITALSEAAMMTSYERNGDIIKLAAYAPMFASLKGARQWNVDMMYFTNTALVLSANYYVQQLFMQNQGKYLLDASVKYADGFEDTYLLTPDSGSSSCKAAAISKLYYVASANTAGNIVLKIVNASGDDIDLNVALQNTALRGVASVTTLQNDDYKVKNTDQETPVKPEKYTIGAFENNTIGFIAKKYSVTSITIDVK